MKQILVGKWDVRFWIKNKKRNCFVESEFMCAGSGLKAWPGGRTGFHTNRTNTLDILT